MSGFEVKKSLYKKSDDTAIRLEDERVTMISVGSRDSKIRK